MVLAKKMLVEVYLRAECCCSSLLHQLYQVHISCDISLGKLKIHESCCSCCKCPIYFSSIHFQLPEFIVRKAIWWPIYLSRARPNAKFDFRHIVTLLYHKVLDRRTMGLDLHIQYRQQSTNIELPIPFTITCNIVTQNPHSSRQIYIKLYQKAYEK
jgi:hypothetical protein